MNWAFILILHRRRIHESTTMSMYRICNVNMAKIISKFQKSKDKSVLSITKYLCMFYTTKNKTKSNVARDYSIISFCNNCRDPIQRILLIHSKELFSRHAKSGQGCFKYSGECLRGTLLVCFHFYLSFGR